MHRSVRYVRFSLWRVVGWALVAMAVTGAQLHFSQGMIRIYGRALEGLLTLARVPFEPGTQGQLAAIAIPSWSVATFNPVAVLPGILAYTLLGLALTFAAWWIPRIPFPLGAWISLLGMLLLVTTFLLSLAPVPRFTPEIFSGLWLKTAVATALIYPWFWVILVGPLPIPKARVALWGLAAWAVFGLWNVLRLAFFLALARAAGVLWLPIAFIFGCTLLDCFVFIIAFSRVMEPAGREWEEPA